MREMALSKAGNGQLKQKIALSKAGNGQVKQEMAK